MDIKELIKRYNKIMLTFDRFIDIVVCINKNNLNFEDFENIVDNTYNVLIDLKDEIFNILKQLDNLYDKIMFFKDINKIGE